MQSIATRDISAMQLTGTQALVSLLLLQAERDRGEGSNTAGYVSGYRGSPLGGLDMELWRRANELVAADIRFEPGLNEDLAATAIWGTQQLATFAPARVDGVFSLWYGKGPGVDRSGDPFKHGNHAGASARGGVLLAFGDDHAAKSSTVSHQSEQALAAHGIPVLSPSSVEEIIRFGLFGWALSRYSRLWVAIKLVNETAETLAGLTPPRADMPIVLPDHGIAAAALDPRQEFAPLQDEMTVQRLRQPLAWRFADANQLDRKVFGRSDAPLGIICHGKGYGDVRQALVLLEMDDERAAELGIRLLKVGMIWPLSPAPVMAFAEGTRELLFVEEKKAFLELQAAHLLFNQPDRPMLLGKRDEFGRPLLPADEMLDPLGIAIVIGERLVGLGRADRHLVARLDELRARRAKASQTAPAPVGRTPYFCSGCPHSTSTVVPDGAVALSGIGCHGMAVLMKRNTLKSVHMGGEGANWIGAAPFVLRKHVFQNLGDGTYSHSGLLAIRAAVQARANITYKVLYNSAVAMTGGQPVEGAITVGQIARQVLAQDVANCVVVSQDVDRLRRERSLPAEVALHDRAELDLVQKRLAKIEGVTVLIYDQQCATEARRLRKRGEQVAPDVRAFIHPGICEGCGDCSVQSNCVSITPLETAFGLRRAIDQNSCNQDLSCVKGFCPSFVTVKGAALRRPGIAPALKQKLEQIPEAPLASARVGYSILIAGVGGTGVVTISQLLAAAGRAAGFAVTSYNMTGLAQKGGAVASHLRFLPPGASTVAARLGTAEANLLIGCDLVASAAREVRSIIDPAAGRAIYNTHAAPTAEFQTNRDHRIDRLRLIELIDTAGADGHGLAATTVVEQLLGDPLGVNAFLVGAAYQRGLLPFSLSMIRDAIVAHGIGAAVNLAALDLGRMAVHGPKELDAFLEPDIRLPATLAEVRDHHARHLTHYQNKAYAMRFNRIVAEVEAVESRVMPGCTDLTLAVTRNLARLMAYKDEYEVARQLTDPQFAAQIRRRFGPKAQLSFNLAPPILGGHGRGGRPAKHRFGPWLRPLLVVLAKMKGLRGTAFDPFGRAQERKLERLLIVDFEKMLRNTILPRLSAENHTSAVALVAVADQIRGFGPVKMASMTEAKERWNELVGKFERQAVHEAA